MIAKALRALKKKTLDILFYFLDSIIPKDDKIIIFGSAGGRAFNGNPRAVFDYVIAHKNKYKPFFFLKREIDRTTYGDALQAYIISNKSLKDRMILLRARTLVGAHGQADFGISKWSRRKIFIQTWHGRGTKNDGFTYDGYTKEMRRQLKKHNRLVTAFITASKIDSGEKARTFNICDTKLFPLGYPRNDALVRKLKQGFLSQLKSQLESVQEHKKVILYAPTFRHYESAKFFPFEDFSLDKLNSFLKEHSILLLIRRHINDAGIFPLKGENIVELGHNICQDVNDVFADVDILITDYSSIFMDFLLIERPIIFIPYDLERYEKERGFIYGDYDHWTPGYKAYSFSGLLEEFENILNGNDSYESDRRASNKLFNAGQSADSSKKVFDLIEHLLERRPIRYFK